MLENLSPEKPKQPCKIGRMILELEPADSKILADALEDPRWTANSLSKALTSRGLPVARDTMDMHMKKVCQCSKN